MRLSGNLKDLSGKERYENIEESVEVPHNRWF